MAGPKARLFKVYYYRGDDKKIWYEVLDTSTGRGVSWAEEKEDAIVHAKKKGYKVLDQKKPVLKFQRVKKTLLKEA